MNVFVLQKSARHTHKLVVKICRLAIMLHVKMRGSFLAVNVVRQSIAAKNAKVRNHCLNRGVSKCKIAVADWKGHKAACKLLSISTKVEHFKISINFPIFAESEESLCRRT